MLSIRWLEKRRTHWERLEQLVGKAQKGLAALDSRELQELGLLYRQTASDLSVALEDASSAQIAAYLNRLLGRSHNLLYLGQRPKGSRLVEFYADAYPRLFRETLPVTMIATALFLAALAAGWAVTLHDPGFAHRILGPEMIDSIARRQMWTHSVVAMKPVAASGITTNNLSVSFSMFAAGITGLGTLLLLAFNGLLLGVVGAATWRAGMALSLWSFVAPHGALELPAILIAGASGLELARGLFFPGLLPRRDSLARAGGRAVRLLLGMVPVLIVAGAIEGFFSASDAPAAMKFALSAALFTLLALWLFGRGGARRATAA